MEKASAHQPPVFDLDTVLTICDGNYRTSVSMVHEFVRTSLLQVGMLRNWLIIEEHDKLLATADTIRFTANRIGASWLKRATTEFMRLLPDMPASSPPTSHRPASKKKDTDAEADPYSLNLKALRNLEIEIQRIGSALDVVCKHFSLDAHSLNSIVEEHGSEGTSSEAGYDPS